MRMGFITNDTRGGVQPYVALALAVREAGHEVCAVAPAGLAALFETAGIAVATLDGASGADMAAATTVAEQGTVAALRATFTEMPHHLAAWTRTVLDMCHGCDVLTGGIGGMVIGLAVAEKLGIPFVPAHLQPLGAPSGDYAPALIGGLPPWLGRSVTRGAHRLSDAMLWMMFRGPMRRVRRDVLGLEGRPTATDGPVIYGFSPAVVPMPRASGRHVTGWWRPSASADWKPPPALANFLARPSPVVSIGFGSMGGTDPIATGNLVRSALRDAGARAVVLGGWGGMRVDDDADLHFAEALPHDWLFPLMAANIHHGGAGTTGAGLLAGVPSIVVPHALDQPFWASRVAALGVGSTIARRRMTRARLASAVVDALSDSGMQDRARALGAVLAHDEGAGGAAAVLARTKRH